MRLSFVGAALATALLVLPAQSAGMKLRPFSNINWKSFQVFNTTPERVTLVDVTLNYRCPLKPIMLQIEGNDGTIEKPRPIFEPAEIVAENLAAKEKTFERTGVFKYSALEFVDLEPGETVDVFGGGIDCGEIFHATVSDRNGHSWEFELE